MGFVSVLSPACCSFREIPGFTWKHLNVFTPFLYSVFLRFTTIIFSFYFISFVRENGGRGEKTFDFLVGFNSAFITHRSNATTDRGGLRCWIFANEKQSISDSSKNPRLKGHSIQILCLRPSIHQRTPCAFVYAHAHGEETASNSMQITYERTWAHTFIYA